MMGAKIQHTTGRFDQADISGDKEASQEKVRSHLVCANNLSCVTSIEANVSSQ